MTLDDIERDALTEVFNHGVGQAAGPAHQPARNPGAACDFDSDEATTVRSARSGSSNGEAKAAAPGPPKISDSYTSSLRIHRSCARATAPMPKSPPAHAEQPPAQDTH